MRSPFQSVFQAVLLLFIPALAALATGCASTRPVAQPSAFGTELAGVDVGALPIFDGPTGLRTSWDSLVAACARADVVLIGEMHNHPVGLAVAARLYEQTANRKPNSAALSLEFFNRDQQAALDDYLAGLTDEAGFRESAGLNPGNYPAGHRAMVETARSLDQPVTASNAPRRYTTLARKEGYDRLRGLTDEQRRLFVVPEALTEGPYRDSFFELMSGMTGHGGAGAAEDEERTPEAQAEADEKAHEMVLGFFRSQNLWDATMAGAIAHAVRDGRAPVFHVVGQFHVDNGGGLAQRLRALLPDAEIIVVSMSDATDETRPEEDADRADWIIHVGPAE